MRALYIPSGKVIECSTALHSSKLEKKKSNDRMLVYKFKYSSGICKRLFHYPSPLLKKRKTKSDPQTEDHKEEFSSK